MRHIPFLLYTLLCFSVITANGQDLQQMLTGVETNAGNSDTWQAQARSMVVQGRTHEAVVCYASMVELAKRNRSSSKGVEAELMAEYAYALALNHDFELALLNIDRARALGTKYGDYFTAQILYLMGYETAGNEFARGAEAPHWLSADVVRLKERFATSTTINHDRPNDALRRANSLAATRQHVQAVALYEELMAAYPQAHVIPIGYSALWEQLGAYGKAAELLRSGIAIMPQDSTLASSLQAYQNHLHQVEQSATDSKGWRKFVGSGQGILYYVGATAANDMFSLNFREGFYTNTRFNMAFNLGLSFGNDMMIGNVGLSMYKTWNWFVAGFSIDDQFSDDLSDSKSSTKHTFSISPLIGLSFLSKSGNSSFDITYGFGIPFSSDGLLRSTISIGQTFYFDIKGKRK